MIHLVSFDDWKSCRFSAQVVNGFLRCVSLLLTYFIIIFKFNILAIYPTTYSIRFKFYLQVIIRQTYLTMFREIPNRKTSINNDTLILSPQLLLTRIVPRCGFIARSILITSDHTIRQYEQFECTYVLALSYIEFCHCSFILRIRSSYYYKSNLRNVGVEGGIS